MNRSALFVGATLLAAARLHGQQSDSAASTSVRQRAWVSAGIGVGSVGGAIGMQASAWYSPGRFIVGARSAADAPIFFGDGRGDKAFLVGITSRGITPFAFVAIGTAKAHDTHRCDCSSSSSGPPATVMAYHAAFIANAEIPGIGIDVFGVLGPRRTRYTVAAVSIQLGWFGDPPD